MTVSEYIVSEFSEFGVKLSDNTLNALLIDNGIDSNTEYDPTIAKKVIAGYIPKLLLKPQMSEGDFSIKYDRDSIISYYNVICGELGIENKLNPKPKIRNMSNRW